MLKKREKSEEKWKWFLTPARYHFSFLVDEYEFVELPVGELRQPEIAIHFRKDALVVSPAVDGSLISVWIQEQMCEGSPLFGQGKAMYMLERLRCPDERLLPEQRQTTHGATTNGVFLHDAEILKRHFPDVLAGCCDFLACENLPSNWHAMCLTRSSSSNLSRKRPNDRE